MFIINILYHLPLFDLYKIVENYSNFCPNINGNEYIKYRLDNQNENKNEIENNLEFQRIYNPLKNIRGVLDIIVHQRNNSCLILIPFRKQKNMQGSGANIIVLNQDFQYLYSLSIKDPTNDTIKIDSKNRIYVANDNLYIYNWNHKRRSIQLLRTISVGDYLESVVLDRFDNMHIISEIFNWEQDGCGGDFENENNKIYTFDSNFKLISKDIIKSGSFTSAIIDEKGTMYNVYNKGREIGNEDDIINYKTIYRFIRFDRQVNYWFG